MRKHTKLNILSLCHSIKELHAEISQSSNLQNQIHFLSICQEAAIKIGTTLESEIVDYHNIIELLELYCEELYNTSNKHSISFNDMTISNNFIDNITVLIDKIQVQYHVVFFPYQSSMWDCLESIWTNLSQNDSFKCSVVPIPYYTFNKHDATWEYQYDGQNFPDYLNIKNFLDFQFETTYPDIVFIHNPYDQYNQVTRVDSRFFSSNIKNYTKTLIYVPYYVTKGNVLDSHFQLQSYRYIDYIITQTKESKERFVNTPFYNKLLALGSPKFDKVINTCKNGGIYPSEWEHILIGKKVFMLNTTISTLLIYESDLFSKLKSIFEFVQTQDDIAIIWRPHPLLEATINSMHPHLKPIYDELLAYFINAKIGVLDKTADLVNTIALSDAYIGEFSGSVINLFTAAQKPIFLLDYTIKNNRSLSFPPCIHLEQIVKNENSFFAVSNKNLGLFKLDASFSTLSYIAKVPGEKCNPTIPSHFTIQNDNIYFSPYYSKKYFSYNINSNEYSVIHLQSDKAANCFYNISYKNKIIYLPIQDGSIKIFNTKTNILTERTDIISSLKSNNKHIFDSDIHHYQVNLNKLWLCASYTNQIIEFNMDTETYTVYDIGSFFGFSGLAIDGNTLWLNEAGNNIIKWDLINKDYETITPPSDFNPYNNAFERIFPYWHPIVYEKYIVIIPLFSNSILKIDKQTNKASLLASSLLLDSLNDSSTYSRYYNKIINFAAKLDNNTLLIQLTKTGEFFSINLNSDTFSKHTIKFNRDTYDLFINDILDKEFESSVYKYESEIYGFDTFFNHIKSQKSFLYLSEELEKISVNLDGTCGEKICKFIQDDIL